VRSTTGHGAADRNFSTRPQHTNFELRLIGIAMATPAPPAKPPVVARWPVSTGEMLAPRNMLLCMGLFHDFC